MAYQSPQGGVQPPSIPGAPGAGREDSCGHSAGWAPWEEEAVVDLEKASEATRSLSPGQATASRSVLAMEGLFLTSVPAHCSICVSGTRPFSLSSTRNTSRPPDGWGFPQTNQFSNVLWTPSGCPTIRFRSDTICLP